MTQGNLQAVSGRAIVTTVSAQLSWSQDGKAEFKTQLLEEAKLNALIAESLAKVKV